MGKWAQILQILGNFGKFGATFMKIGSKTREMARNSLISYTMILWRSLDPILVVFDFWKLAAAPIHGHQVQILPKSTLFDFSKKKKKTHSKNWRFWVIFGKSYLACPKLAEMTQYDTV